MKTRSTACFFDNYVPGKEIAYTKQEVLDIGPLHGRFCVSAKNDAIIVPYCVRTRGPGFPLYSVLSLSTGARMRTIQFPFTWCDVDRDETINPCISLDPDEDHFWATDSRWSGVVKICISDGKMKDHKLIQYGVPILVTCNSQGIALLFDGDGKVVFTRWGALDFPVVIRMPRSVIPEEVINIIVDNDRKRLSITVDGNGFTVTNFSGRVLFSTCISSSYPYPDYYVYRVDFPEFGGMLLSSILHVLTFVKFKPGKTIMDFAHPDIKWSVSELGNPDRAIYNSSATIARFGAENFATFDGMKGEIRLFWSMRLRMDWIAICVATPKMTKEEDGKRRETTTKKRKKTRKKRSD